MRIGMLAAALIWGVSSQVAAMTVEEAFLKLKTLAGEWQGQTEEGELSGVSYTINSDGHTLVENLHGMLTLYTIDGNSILATHFCSAGNQPRMRATDFFFENRIAFEFVDISGLDEGEHHISGLTLEFVGDNTLRQHWRSRNESGEETSGKGRRHRLPSPQNPACRFPARGSSI